jgi:hypothetical protein
LGRFGGNARLQAPFKAISIQTIRKLSLIGALAKPGTD